MIDYIASPAEWRDLLDHFRAWDTTANTESALMKFVSVYHSRNMFSFSRVLTPEWVTEHHGDHVSGCPQLTGPRGVAVAPRESWSPAEHGP